MTKMPSKVRKFAALAALTMSCASLFAYNGGYENSLLTDTVIGGITYKGYGNNTVTKRTESGATIAANTYAQCKKLKSVNLTGVTSIGDAAFAYSALESVTLPATVKSLGYIAFGGCTNLTSATVGSWGWYDAAKEPFRDCVKLATMTVPGNPPAWDFASAFPSVKNIRCPVASVASWQKLGLTAVGLSQVTFGKNGGVGGADSVMVANGSAMPKISVPTRSGYVFDGYWTTTGASGVQYYKADGTSAKNWDKTADATLWAKWVKSCRLTFGKNGGTGGDSWVTVNQGAKPHDVKVPTRAGYLFGGYWTTTGAGGVEYFNENGKALLVWDKNSDATLWAKWTKAVSCKVTFGKNGGTGGDSWVTVTTGNKPHDVVVPKKANSTFCGYWNSIQSGGKQYIDANGKAVCVWDKTANATLWAKWSNKITFGKNGGTGGDNYVTAYQNVKPHDITPPTRAGYAFDGYWTTTGTGGVQYFYADGSAARTWDKTANVTLWAKWIQGTPVRVTLGLNGGTGKTYVYAVNGKAMPRIGVPTKSGYTFGGYWTTTGTGGVKYYNADGTSAKNWNKTGAATLWAKWVKTVSQVTSGEATSSSLWNTMMSTSITSDEALLPSWTSGYYRGTFADGSGVFDLLVDEFDDDDGAMAYIYAQTTNGVWSEECEAMVVDETLLLVCEDLVLKLTKEDSVFVISR